MRAVWSWLRDLVELDQDISAEQAAVALTAIGFEVESVEHLGHDFQGVVVAEVVGKRPHPKAERLTLVDVIDTPGGSATQVVCGANNVPEPGGRVLWAKPGSVLPGIGEIATRAIKGVDSPGMLCAEDELGLGESHDGIIVLGPADILRGEGDLLGAADAIERLGLRDTVFDIGVHANRGDALGHLGLARELVATVGGRVRPPSFSVDEDAGLATDRLVSVHIDDPDACPRYTARVIDGLRVGPSPRWMQQRLRAVGVRPLSNLVDITNYVLFELGQPLHAFDYERVRGAEIRVRRARAGERLTTLDEVERVLEADDLLICDGTGPVALAGVMGGSDSEVHDGTTRVLLESAGFASAVVRRTARRLGLHSEASARFERGVDPSHAGVAAARAAQLMARLGGGKVAAGMVDVYPRPSQPTRLSLRTSRTSALVGIDFTRSQIADVLGRLGIEASPDPADEDRLDVQCPTHRSDLVREVDLIEEVIRLHGYDKLPATLPTGRVELTRQVDHRLGRIRRALAASGMSEAITFGFTSRERVASLGLAEDDRRARAIALRNPMSSEQAVMRTSLLPNLLAAVAHNRKYGVADVALFEIGSVFLAKEAPAADDPDAVLPDEPVQVAGVLAGRQPGWLGDGPEVDFFDIKGAVEHVLAALLPEQVGQVGFEADDSIPFMHPGVCARVVLPGGATAGYVGEIHPRTRRALDVEPRCFGFELALSAFPAPTATQMRAIPRYPAITRDVSMFLDEAMPAGRVRGLIEAAAEPLLEDIAVVEDFRDPAHVPAGKKGMLWSLTYRSLEGTLTDAEVDRAHEAIVARLLADLPAERR
ncbi:phenylalanine--tRNA ligase subunit beta [Haliangium sp.]|uniref:phenylalanine--tRNA ligase subunit beta n=1 Tax=Haliangium sp. TaxID=2663208 RepID=UPI003D115CCB